MVYCYCPLPQNLRETSLAPSPRLRMWLRHERDCLGVRSGPMAVFCEHDNMNLRVQQPSGKERTEATVW
jgi:hypothetical protein